MYWVCCQRLNLQHYLWKQQQGHLIHPNILSIKQENLKIADIGTGTAIFLLDLADSLPPSTQLHGFDIDLTQCPPKPWLPANVNLRTLDVYDEPSEDLSEQYGNRTTNKLSHNLPLQVWLTVTRHYSYSILSLCYRE